MKGKEREIILLNLVAGKRLRRLVLDAGRELAGERAELIE